MKGKITVWWLGKTAGGLGGDGRLHVHCLSGMFGVSWGIRTRHGLSQAWLWVAHGAGHPIPTIETDCSLNPAFVIGSWLPLSRTYLSRPYLSYL